jgi:hypothetical protein
VAVVALLSAVSGFDAATTQSRQVVEQPSPDIGVSTLQSRRAAQLATVDRFDVPHDFRFTDWLAGSGISFVNVVTADSRKDHKGVHYDHGNGLAVADVDLDGRLDLYFMTQIGSNELWRGAGGGRFENITERAGVAVADRITVTASFADVDNDGDPDLYVTTVRQGNLLFLNDGSGRFTDVSATSGLDHVGHSSGAVFFDFDRDGLLDCFLTNVGRYTSDTIGEGGYYVGVGDAFSGHLFPDRYEPSLLFLNEGGARFREVSAQVGLRDLGWAGDATIADFDRDRFPDLYVLNMQGDDHYYRNVGGERFVERTAELFPNTPWGAMGVKVFDYDNDGLFDLLLTDMHSDMSEDVPPEREKTKAAVTASDEFLQGGGNNLFGNAFYRNLGGGSFEEASDELGLENYWPWGVSVGDLNADGFEDVFITASMNFPYRYGINSVLLNNRGAEFLDAEFILGVEPRADGRVKKPWEVMDCGGGERDHAFCAGRTGVWEIHANLGTRAAALLDLDADGDLDIVTNEFGSEPQVLRSDLAERRALRYLEIRLVGRRSNRDGIGAVVRVHAAGRILSRWNDGKSGYLSRSSMPLYVGLGDATAVERIEVEWPSGVDQTVTEGLEVNGLVVIEEPTEEPSPPADEPAS